MLPSWGAHRTLWSFSQTGNFGYNTNLQIDLFVAISIQDTETCFWHIPSNIVLNVEVLKTWSQSIWDGHDCLPSYKVYEFQRQILPTMNMLPPSIFLKFSLVLDLVVRLDSVLIVRVLRPALIVMEFKAGFSKSILDWALSDPAFSDWAHAFTWAMFTRSDVHKIGNAELNTRSKHRFYLLFVV